VNIAVRVCHIWHHFFAEEFGGVERYIFSLSDFLSQQDQSMHFFVITDKAAYIPFSHALRIPSYQRIKNLELHRLGPSVSSLLRGAYYKSFHRTSKTLNNMLTASLYRKAISLREVDKVDIFHVHGFWQPLYPTIGLLLSQHFHRPLVVTLHGDSLNCNDKYSMPLSAPTTLNVLARADVIITYSKEILNGLRDLGLDKRSRWVPNFVDTRLFKRPVSSGNGSGTRLVMVSRLSASKDPITAIRAFAQVRKEFPEATFKIVGNGPLYERLNHLVQDLNLEGAVTLFGMKSDVRKYFWNSDISIGTKSSYLTTLEAWAAGLAVVVPESGILKELVSNGENGLLVPSGNIDQLSSKLISLIRNKHLRTTIAANGTLTSEKYDIRKIAPSIANIYKSLL
jgi:glycosyltransferase involved in cell wall biosynthesis